MNNLNDLKIEEQLLKAQIEQLIGNKTYIENSIKLLTETLAFAEKNIEVKSEKLEVIDEFFDKLAVIAEENDCVKILQKKIDGMSNEAIAIDMGMHRNTVANKLKKFEELLK